MSRPLVSPAALRLFRPAIWLVVQRMKVLERVHAELFFTIVTL